MARLREEMFQKLSDAERALEASIEKAEQRVSSQVDAQRKLEQKIAEVRGGLTGLSEEVQPLMKRIEQADTRFWDFRRSLEDEVRSNLSYLMTEQQSTSEKLRALREEATASQQQQQQSAEEPRLKRLEEALAELAAAALPRPGSPPAAAASSPALLEEAMVELNSRIEAVASSCREKLAGLHTQLEQQQQQHQEQHQSLVDAAASASERAASSTSRNASSSAEMCTSKVDYLQERTVEISLLLNRLNEDLVKQQKIIDRLTEEKLELSEQVLVEVD